jgi:mono/diheme cytochrome c family protein
MPGRPAWAARFFGGSEMKARFLVVGLLAGLAFIPVSRADDAKPPAQAAATAPAAPASNIPNANLIPPDLGANGPTSQPTGKEWPKPSEAQFDEGKRIFQNRCARCHGWNMVNLGSIAFDLRQFPHDDAVRFFHDVRYGKKAMPSWKEILSTEEIADIWAYVRIGGKL